MLTHRNHVYGKLRSAEWQRFLAKQQLVPLLNPLLKDAATPRLVEA